MLTQTEADELIALPKTFVSLPSFYLPGGSDWSHELVGRQGQEKFLLDASRSSMRLSKLKLQSRGRSVVVLVRLDIDGAPHTNPDGTRVGGTHIHIYKPDCEARWAVELDNNKFSCVKDIEKIYLDFCKFCAITPIKFQGAS